MSLTVSFPDARRIDLRNGGWLSVHEQLGRGPTLVMLHGFTDRAESFRLIAPHLAGRHLVMPDLRGHGESFRADVHDLSDLASDIADMFQAMALSNTVLVGHSMGALIALTLATGYLKVKGLVLLSGSLKPASPAFQEIADQFAALPVPLNADHPFLDEWYACGRPVSRQFLERLRASCISMRPQDWANCLAALSTADLRSMAQSLTIPSLVIAGNMDSIFSSDQRLLLRQHLTPTTEIVMQDVGHNPHWEDPQEVAAAIQSFLDEFTERV